jgi:hypothetical protein
MFRALFLIAGCTIRLVHRFYHWRSFLALAIVLIVAGVFRFVWATRLDGFSIDEPWHITAGVAYVRKGEYYLNPGHPPLVKLKAGLVASRSAMHPAAIRDAW